MPARVPLLADLKTHPVLVAMAARARTSPRNHANLRLPKGGWTKVLEQGATRKTCPLLRLEGTMAAAGEIIIRQGVVEIAMTARHQEETEITHALRHLRLGGRRRANEPRQPRAA